ncbi:Macrolide export ATP-binding/permease protein MacB [Anatilimnocola aggregata]|uniref:Macrolide export ATP-binding/permease protein MacB n=1 Tax=Anatilimnocola aggregata TaxID=2528021 RepID=A0A517YNQ0_9BACT|nr:FtsX-like permease family protein [Anatilimnocola aggregata]QDU31855.1 Macrolide export ATP-binding/permease protein MacB [Anatilimnocola aggregata]
MSLRSFSTRSLTSRLGRTLLTILSIVIGVSAVVSVSVITATTRNAYKIMFATVTGNATLEVTVPGNAGFDIAPLAKVKATPGVDVAVPLLERPTAMMFGEKRIKLSILGIDPKLDPQVRDYAITQGRMASAITAPGRPRELVLDEGFATQLGMKLGDLVSIRTTNAKYELEIVGLVKPKGGSAMRQMALALLPLERAQAMYNRRGYKGHIDSIQIVTKPEADVNQVMAAIAPQLPEGLTIHPPSGNTQLMKKTLVSTEQSLLVSTIFSLVLSVFIILNTFFMNVGERRRQMAIMRAIGATGKQLMFTLLAEAFVLGAIGTAIGIPMGLGIAWVLNRSMARGFDVIMPDPQISWLPIVLAGLLGIGVSLVGAFVPAWRASKVSPLEGMSRVSRQDIEGTGWGYLVLGVVLMIAGSVTIYMGITEQINIYAGPFGSVALLVGVVFLSPLVLEPLIKVFGWLLSPITRVEGVMAQRQILRHRVRTQLTIGVLFVAACIGIGMTNSIKDNLRDLADWKDAALTSDFFVRSMMPDMASGLAPDIPDEVGAEIEALPSLGRGLLERIVFTEGQVNDKKGVAHSVRVVARDFIDPKPPSFDLIEGSVESLREKLFDGQAVIGSVLAHDLKVKLGDDIELATLKGPEKIRVAAIANDYLVAGLSVHLERKTAERLLGIQGVDGYAVRVPDQQDLENVRRDLEAITKKHSLLLQSNAEISWAISAMVAGVEVGLWGLVYVAFLVAMIGVVNTLTMNVLEQTRELSMLRIVAMTKSQVRKTILTQALLIGMSGLSPGIVAGVLVAFIMNLAFEPSFGRRIDFHIYPGLLGGALVGAIAITLLAAWLPARRAANVDVAQALHYD